MSYTRFATLMTEAYPTYYWEPLTVTTIDKYELTMFHIKNEAAQAELGAQGPVLFQHGASMDGTDFIAQGGMSDWNSGTASMIQMADLGYDIYMGNNRGTEYSQGHAFISKPSDNPKAYWNYTYEHYAHDIIAFSKAMVENASGDQTKGWYFGYSQGTIQALVAMAKYQCEFEKYIHRAVLLAPCFGIPGANGAEESIADYTWLYDEGYYVKELAKVGVYAIDPLTWEADKRRICDDLSAEICDYFEDIYADPIYPWVFKNSAHWLQNWEANRFQEYVEDWKNPYNMESTLYPLEQISNVAVSMFVGTADDICPFDAAEQQSYRIPTLQNFYSLDGDMHDFVVSNKSDLVNLLVKELTTETVSTPNRETVVLMDYFADE